MIQIILCFFKPNENVFINVLITSEWFVLLSLPSFGFEIQKHVLSSHLTLQVVVSYETFFEVIFNILEKEIFYSC